MSPNLVDLLITNITNIMLLRSVGYAFAYGGQDASLGKTFIGTSDFFLTGDADMEFW
jgi:hypothetical protein